MQLYDCVEMYSKTEVTLMHVGMHKSVNINGPLPNKCSCESYIVHVGHGLVAQCLPLFIKNKLAIKCGIAINPNSKFKMWAVRLCGCEVGPLTLLKFVFFEKATKFDEISILLLTNKFVFFVSRYNFERQSGSQSWNFIH